MSDSLGAAAWLMRRRAARDSSVAGPTGADSRVGGRSRAPKGWPWRSGVDPAHGQKRGGIGRLGFRKGEGDVVEEEGGQRSGFGD